MTDSKFIAAAIIAAILSGGAIAPAQLTPDVASDRPTAQHAEQAIRGAIAGIAGVGHSLGDDQSQCVSVDTFSDTGGGGFTVAAREYYTIDFALSVSYLQECAWLLYSYSWRESSLQALGGGFGGTMDEIIGEEYDRITTEDPAAIISISEVQAVARVIAAQHPTSATLPDRDTFIEEVKTTLVSTRGLSQSAVEDITFPSSFPFGYVGGKEGSDQDLTGQVVFYRDPQHDRDWVVMGVRPLP